MPTARKRKCMKSTIERSDCGVWMLQGSHISVSRYIATLMMDSLGLDSSNFRKRDEAIMGIADFVNSSLDEVAGVELD